MQDSGLSAQQYMGNWLFQINYPIVDIILNNELDQATPSSVELSQSRFSLSIFDEVFFEPIVSPFK